MSVTMAVVVNRIIDTSMVNNATVARICGVNIRSVQRWRLGSVDPKRAALERLLELRAVLDLVSAVYRPEGAAIWLRSPVPDLGYSVPVDLIRDGEFMQVIGCLTRHC